MIRNMGTIGGSLVHADPAADLPAAMLALGASLVLTGKAGSRTVGADAFFIDVFQTALGANEILTAIEVPVAGSSCAYAKHPDPASGYAIVGIAAQLRKAAGKVTAARVAMTGLGPRPLRLSGVETALAGGADAAAAAARASENLVFVDDARGSAAYKANLARVFTARALTAAMAK
jgi:carbon-monoxide dehydrogenase medium subunit